MGPDRRKPSLAYPFSRQNSFAQFFGEGNADGRIGAVAACARGNFTPKPRHRSEAGFWAKIL
jgi:hypothetical protein